MKGRPVNRDPFRLEVHPGRLQPFTVWRGHETWYFAASEDCAMKFIRRRLNWEAQ